MLTLYQLQDDSPQVHVDIFKDSSEGLYFATSPEVQALGAGDSPEEAVEEFALNASDYIQYERENGRAGLVSTSEASHCMAWCGDGRHESSAETADQGLHARAV